MFYWNIVEKVRRKSFGRIVPADYKEPAYKKTIENPDGNKSELTSVAFGKRKDIETKIGAIVVLEDRKIKQKIKE